MTDAGLNIAIAESCKLSWFFDGKRFWDGPERAKSRHFTEDLNAMHEVENTLTEHEQARFQDVLAFMFVGPSEHYPLFEVVHATARQRAEAFLRCKGLWKEQHEPISG